MALAPLEYADTALYKRYAAYVVSVPDKESGKPRPHLDLNAIKTAPRDVQVLALSQLKSEAFLERQRRIEGPPVGTEGEVPRWLSYYRDVLRFVDLDKLAQRPDTRKTWFGPKAATIPITELGAGDGVGQIPLSETRFDDPAWQDVESAAEQAANTHGDDGTGAHGAPVLILLGYEYPGDKGMVQGVVCGVPARLDPRTGELLPDGQDLIVNSRHLSSEDREAKTPRVGRMMTADEEEALAIDTACDSSEPAGREEIAVETGATASAVAAVSTPSRAWAQHWKRMNEVFMVYQDENPRSLEEFSWPSKFGRDNTLKFIGIAPYSTTPPANRRLVALIDDIMTAGCAPPLLDQLLDATNRLPRAKSSIRWEFSESQLARNSHVGHMDGVFGLDRTQRLALWQTTVAAQGDAVAVSGPPGTGKTSMLRGVIGTLVVQAALDRKPAVVLAASQTNQATTNMIKAFAEIAMPYVEGEEVRLEHRWLDGFPSYGSYFPSSTQLKNEPHMPYQLLTRVRTYAPALMAQGLAAIDGSAQPLSALAADAVAPLRAKFRERFNLWLDSTGHASAAAPSEYLWSMLAGLVGEKGALRRANTATDTVHEILSRHSVGELHKARRRSRRLERSLPADRDAKIGGLAEMLHTTQQSTEKLRGLLAELFEPPPERWVDRVIAAVRSVLPREWQASYARERASLTRIRRALIDARNGETLPSSSTALSAAALQQIRRDSQKADDLQKEIARWERWQVRLASVKEARRLRIATLAGAVQDMKRIEQALALIVQIAGECRGDAFGQSFRSGVFKPASGSGVEQAHALGKRLFDSIGAAGPGKDLAKPKLRYEFEEVLDVTIRYKAFHLAMRYWEARWVEEAAIALPVHPEKEVRVALERAAMLSPVLVATVQTIPALALYLDANTTPKYLTEVADWLIVDEAGQVPPHLCVPVASLAKRTLVVGDVEQLEPVVEIDRRTNIDLRRKHGLQAMTTVHERDHLDIERGNFMAVAQYAAARHENAAEGRYGVMLKYHYRCRKTIIEFCNALVYGAIDPLVPMIPDAGRFARSPREATADEALLPPMGFVTVEGTQLPSGGSQVNVAEVEAIVDWLKENRAAIAKRYGSVEQAVAVIAPYGAQVNRLRDELRKLGLKVPSPKSAASAPSPSSRPDGAPEDAPAMVVGTVHALQGAEKEIVLFSAVNDGSGKSAFIDRRKSMLNVAVSRAKHSFVAFGHPKVILKRGTLPGGVLGGYLREHGWRLFPRELVVLESSGKVPLVGDAFGVIAKGIATGGHIRTIDFHDGNRPYWREEANAQSLLEQVKAFAEYGLRHYDRIWLATDDDTEGEAIAWHVMDLVRSALPGVPLAVFRRLRFYAMTPEALRDGRRFSSAGVDPRRVRAAIARAIADRFIAMEIHEATGTGGGRVSAALLDEIDRLEVQRETPLHIETLVLADAAHVGAVQFVRLERDSPLGRAQRFTSLEPDSELAAPDAAVEIETVGPLRWIEPEAPQTSTAQVLRRLTNDLHMTPKQAMDALQNIYTGSAVNAPDGGDE